MKKPHQEELLQALYEQSKSQHKQPASITKKVLSYAKAQRSPLAFLMQWQTVCAALIVGVLWLHNKEQVQPVYSVTADYSESDEKIYYHQVNYGPIEQSEGGNNNELLTQAPEYLAYLESLSKLQNANQLAGVVKKLEGDVVVEVCQLGLVKLSGDLLKQIDNPRVVNRLTIGQNVLLLADNSGKFIDIQQPKSAYQCAE